MPLAEVKEVARPPSKPQLPQVQPEGYGGIVVDDKYRSLHSLTKYAEGFPLTVTYFGQIVGIDNDVREVDPGQSGVYQQYTQIHKLDVRVNDPLSMNYSEDSGRANITGSATIFPDVIPNTYDYFTARTTRGRTALFRIQNITRKSLNRDSLHLAEYQMVGYIDDKATAETLYNSLVKKVSRQYYYHGDRLAEGLSPLLKPQDHEYVRQLEHDFKKIVLYYCTTFYAVQYQTLTLPGQPTSVYDKFLMDYFLKIVSILDYETVDTFKQFGLDRDRYSEQPQFWTAMAERDRTYLDQGNKYMGLVDRNSFSQDHWVAGTGVIGIKKYVYPLRGDMSTATDDDICPVDSSLGLIDTTGAQGSFYASGGNIFQSATGNTPIYKRVLSDAFYVLSRDFYEKQDNWCLLEKVTWDYLEHKSIQLDELVVLTRQYFLLNRLEQFYYGPLLLTFIKASNQSQYT